MLLELYFKSYQCGAAYGVIEGCIWTLYHHVAGMRNISSVWKPNSWSLSCEQKAPVTNDGRSPVCALWTQILSGAFYDVQCFVMFKHLFSQDNSLLSKISHAVWSNCCLHKSQWSSVWWYTHKCKQQWSYLREAQQKCFLILTSEGTWCCFIGQAYCSWPVDG